MKKTLATLLATAIAGNAVAYTPVRGRTEKTYFLQQAVKRTPAQMAKFLDGHVGYTPDVKGVFVNHSGKKRRVSDDYCQTPLDTYLRGLGDCEDFAALAGLWLSMHGYTTKLFAYYPKNKPEAGHAVCVVKEGQGISVICNDHQHTGYKDVEEFIRKECPDWGMYEEFVMDQSRPDGTRTIKAVFRDESQRKLFEE